tara:strand:- start:82659 stop:82823 length:165 start_codon:yes stop_codon:yes gene_type:complete
LVWCSLISAPSLRLSSSLSASNGSVPWVRISGPSSNPSSSVSGNRGSVPEVSTS